MTANKLALALLCVAAFTFTGCATMCTGPQGCISCGDCATGGCASDPCNGCGDLYVDPWVNEPASCCDPCDSCGNYNGQSCGACRPMMAGFPTLWGYRCSPDCEPASCGINLGLCGGCDSSSCDGACDAYVDGCADCASGDYGGGSCPSCNAGVTHNDGVIYSGQPTVTDEIISESSEPPYKPHRTRKIFQPRVANQNGPIVVH